MELPFYLRSEDSPGMFWDGMISLDGEVLHVALNGGGEGEATCFTIPLRDVQGAEFQRGLVGRKFRLTVGSAEIRERFPAGVCGEDVQLMVARDDVEFGTGPRTEGEFERLANQIAQRTGHAREGLPG